MKFAKPSQQFVSPTGLYTDGGIIQKGEIPGLLKG